MTKIILGEKTSTMRSKTSESWTCMDGGDVRGGGGYERERGGGEGVGESEMMAIREEGESEMADSGGGERKTEKFEIDEIVDSINSR